MFWNKYFSFLKNPIMGIKIPITYSELLVVVCVPEMSPHRVSWLWGCPAHSDCACLTPKSGSWIWNYRLPLTQRSHPGMGCCLFGLPSKEKHNSLPVSISKVTSFFRYRMLYQKWWNKIFLRITIIYFAITNHVAKSQILISICQL